MTYKEMTLKSTDGGPKDLKWRRRGHILRLATHVTDGVPEPDYIVRFVKSSGHYITYDMCLNGRVQRHSWSESRVLRNITLDCFARKIQRAWRDCISNPQRLICKTRLQREFGELGFA